MKVAIVAPSPVPFLIGGAEKLFIGMLYNFNKLSIHNVELIKVPCKDYEFWSLIDCYKRFYNLNLDYFDMIISTKYPAWMVKHQNHLLYMQHTCRGVYDLYHLTGKSLNWQKVVNKDSRLKKLGNILNSYPSHSAVEDLFSYLEELKRIEKDLPKRTFEFPGALTRAIIHFLDKVALSPTSFDNPYGIKSYNAISKTVALRKDYFPENQKVQVVYHPSNLEEFHSKSYEFIFTASRLEKLKRIDLLIKAFRKVRGDIQFLIAGTGGQEKHLKKLAKGDNRIKFLGFITDEELIDYYSKALFVPFIPYNEDYGLITIEAMKSKKAVLTTHDSGGVTEFVKNEYNGLITEPNIDSLALAMQELVDNKEKTMQMGENAYKTVEHINWENMVVSLFGKDALKKGNLQITNAPEIIIASSGKQRPHLVVLSTFSSQPPISGGKIRLYNLYKRLADDFRITILSLADTDEVVKFSENFKEIKIKKTLKFNLLSRKISKETGVSSDDIASIEGYKFIPKFEKQFFNLLPSADAVILYHPYLYGMVDSINKPVLLDAPDVEYVQKSLMFNNSKYLSMVKNVEKMACNKAVAIYPTSQEDVKNLKNLYDITDNKFTVIENGIDTKKIKVLTTKEKAELKKRLGLGNKVVAVFVGSLHKPNEFAVNFILKLAKKTNENIIFVIIGSITEVIKEHPSNVIPLGVLTEEEKDIIMKAADIGVNPIVSGSGTNLKLLEYLAYGLIVISTHFGARGIEHSGEILISKIDEFEEVLKNTISNIENLNNLRLKYRKLAEKYDWDIISKKLNKLLKKHLTFEI